MNKVMKQMLIAIMLVAFTGGISFAETELVIVSWGGAYTASQQKAYHEPYMKLNPDIKIINDDSSGTGAAKLRAQVEAGNVTWDLMDALAADAIALCDEGIIEVIDFDKEIATAPDGTSAVDDFGDLIACPCFVPLIVYSVTFGYRNDKFATPPTTIADVFNLKKFPGKRALEKKPVANLEWALIADGVDGNKVYEVLSTPEGVDRAFKKLDTIKDSVIWWSKGAQPPQLLADGEVVIASAYNGRLFNAIAVEKQPISMLWDWQQFDLDGFVVPKGAPHKKEIMEYLKFATDTQRLADQAKFISYGPARKSSAPMVGKHAELGIDMKPHMPTAPANSKQVIVKDHLWWADHEVELTERFYAWLAK
jgi:putative spermidine/putrescine transport system substrate-binding protein